MITAYVYIAIMFFVFMSLSKLWKSKSTLYSKIFICLFWPVYIIVLVIAICSKLKEA